MLIPPNPPITGTLKMDALITSLVRLGPRPSIREVHSALDQSRLDHADIAPWIQTDDRRYFRNRVAITDAFEVLVMTWLPGQSSVPHDHAGSGCALRVMQGQALERTYTQADDGFVDAWSELTIDQHQSVAGDDGGIHSVHNEDASGRTLVTLHVYAPPLKDFRRYVARPEPSVRAGSSRPSRVPPPVEITCDSRRVRLAIIGGGFSGAMTAANLLRLARTELPENTSLDITLVERRGTLGEGVAYGTSDPAHLLNVPASRMSAWADSPSHFLEWATRHAERPVAPGAFLPRQQYGQYIRNTLLEAAAAAAPRVKLHAVFDEVRRIARDAAGHWLVHLGRAPSLEADGLVLALGHRPPSDPLENIWVGPRHRFISDPWRPFAVQDVQPDEPVLIIGSGLTSIDVALSLSADSAHPRTAPVTLLSRRALAPQAHASTPVPTADLGSAIDQLLSGPRPLSALALTQFVRLAVRTHEAAGGDWRGIVDGLRPHTSRLWQALPARERRRWMSQARAFWEVHRHRMAPEVHQRVQSLRRSGTLRLLGGRVIQAIAGAEGVDVLLKLRGDREASSLRAHWVINCTGPSPSNSAEANPAVASLLERGLVSVDDLALGLRTAGPGWSIGHRGESLRDLLIVGTLRKPERWESTAVPELRVQAREAAEALLQQTLASPTTRVAQAAMVS
jgi:uncharacterized NAD(P)/FAD-binding protein YdhS